MRTMYLNRAGLPCTTLTMLDVLKRLRDAEACERPFVCLVDVHKRTINALVERDWIVLATKVLKTAHTYCITGRGKKALKVYEAPPTRRFDGICCRCGERPVGAYRTGKRKPYCDSCMSAVAKRLVKLGVQYANERVCPRCKKRPVKVCSTGRIKPYCVKCLKTIARQERRRKYKRLLKLHQSGAPLPCPKCGEQRYLSGSTVQDYCYQHYREYQNEYLRRKSQEKRQSA